ncbi:helix-turn-helix domain-containing protein [Streptomyces olivaceus]|nr:helix-turn-helix domain-containing protein [Streptomyces olivaceus]
MDKEFDPLTTSLDAEASGQPAEIQAVTRAAQILELLGPQTESITAAEAATRIGLNRTTTYRYCTSLVSAGLLERRPDGSFTYGRLALQLGAYALSRRDVLDLAPPHMRLLAARTHSTAVLSLWGSSGPVVFRVEEDLASVVSVRVKVGTQLDLGSAQAGVFLAFHSDQLRMERLTAGLPEPTRTTLRARLETIRADGYHTQDNGRGAVILAAPVYDEHGLCATVALLNTTEALSTAPESLQLRQLLNCAAQLTDDMGGSAWPGQ